MKSLVLLVLSLHTGACLAQSSLIVRSGNGTLGSTDTEVTMLVGPPVGPFGQTFGANEFLNASTGPPAEIISPATLSGLLLSLPSDPAAQWIGVIGRHQKHLPELYLEAQTWKLILAEFGHDSEPLDTTAELVVAPFPGTRWGVEAPVQQVDPILSEVVAKDRREMIQAIGRLRAELREDDKLTVIVIDGFPVPGLLYNGVILDKSGKPGGEAELYDLFATWAHNMRRKPLAKEYRDLARMVRKKKERVRVAREKPLKAANSRRQREGNQRKKLLAKRLAALRLADADASRSEVIRRLGWTKRQYRLADEFLRRSDV